MRLFQGSGSGRTALLTAILGIAVILSVTAYPIVGLQSQQAANGYIQGTVRSSAGPEAGVWVIAETKDLATPMIKIVVTDDQGRYTLPELPTATYSVWVRGYGLADSTPVTARPATAANAPALDLTAVVAKDKVEAAKVYPGNYWLSMLVPPARTAFPLGQGVNQQTFEGWIHALKSNCNFCHQLGNGITRDLTHVFAAKPELKTSLEAWDYRIQTGIRGAAMSNAANSMNRQFALKMLSDWTDRIAKGETPAVTPPRPAGVERNVVLTLWDWGTDHSFMHDEVSTSKQNPTVNAGGRIYAVSAGHGTLVTLNPNTHESSEIEIPTRQARAEVPSRFPAPNPPSMWWGSERLWAGANYNPADPHNPMLDNKGRVWLTSKIRAQVPAWCSDASASKYAAYTPLRGGGRQASYYDPKTQKFQLIETCYATHHLQFDNDPNETVYFNELSGPIIGWIDTKVYDETLAATNDESRAEKAAVGWCSQVMDTNGDGVITKPFQIAPRGGFDNALYATDTAGGGATGTAATPGAVFDPKQDTQVSYSLYSVIPSPVDDSVWGVAEIFPGYLVRLKRGNNPPESCVTQLFKVPAPGLDPRGVDVDTNGVVWTALAASSHMASFDARKCTDLNGPAKLDGSQCANGWTLYKTNGPTYTGTDVPTDFHYFNWVDQKNVMGFGENTPMATGSNSDSILVLNPQTREWITMRVPYPLGFYSRGMDARLDNPTAPAGFAGWKDRALYANYGTHYVWHIEGGKGTKGKLVKFQVRPNPLAR
jgi:hypothetical protein